jgi:uncharacterized protein
VTYDEKKTDIDTILYKIEEKGYTCYTGGKDNRLFGWIFGILGLLVAGYFLFNLIGGIELPQLSQSMSYGLLFLVGLFTGFHCISMCGGFVVSYTTKAAQEGNKPHKSHLMYATGKTISYTLIGAIFGLIGSIIAFTPFMRGAAGILAGVFLMLFGLKMLNIFPVLRKINITTPKFIARFVGKENRKHSSPLAIGLLNGLMIACGPLQAVYIMAAGTGSMIEGAKLLFIFGLGTLPVMVGFGYFVSIVSMKVANKIVKFSGVLVIALGIIMLNNGLVLTGSGYDFKSLVERPANSEFSGNVAVQKDGYQEIRMDVTRYGWEPDTFVLKAGVPVKWIIDGKEVNYCNNAIQVPGYNLNFDIKAGEQVIEFTPDKEGTVRWSCWMGMIPGTFIVKDDISSADIAQEISDLPKQAAAGCGMGGGCGGCGGGCGSPTCGGIR